MRTSAEFQIKAKGCWFHYSRIMPQQSLVTSQEHIIFYLKGQLFRVNFKVCFCLEMHINIYF